PRLDGTDRVPPGDVADTTADTAVDVTEAHDLSERLEAVLDDLAPRERQVLRMRYALGGQERERSLAEIGERLGLSSERIRQIELQALRKLRWMPRLRRELDDYLQGW